MEASIRSKDFRDSKAMLVIGIILCALGMASAILVPENRFFFPVLVSIGFIGWISIGRVLVGWYWYRGYRLLQGHEFMQMAWRRCLPFRGNTLPATLGRFVVLAAWPLLLLHLKLGLKLAFKMLQGDDESFD